MKCEKCDGAGVDYWGKGCVTCGGRGADPMSRDVRRCDCCGINEDDARLFATGTVGRWLCWRDYERIAPRGYTKCLTCCYEKPAGLPCGEPCA